MSRTFQGAIFTRDEIARSRDLQLTLEDEVYQVKVRHRSRREVDARKDARRAEGRERRWERQFA